MHCWWECQLMLTLCKTIWKLLKNLRVELPCLGCFMCFCLLLLSFSVPWLLFLSLSLSLIIFLSLPFMKSNKCLSTYAFSWRSPYSYVFRLKPKCQQCEIQQRKISSLQFPCDLLTSVLVPICLVAKDTSEPLTWWTSH